MATPPPHDAIAVSRGLGRARLGARRPVEHVEPAIGPAPHELVRVDLRAAGVGVVVIPPGEHVDAPDATIDELRDGRVEVGTGAGRGGHRAARLRRSVGIGVVPAIAPAWWLPFRRGRTRPTDAVPAGWCARWSPRRSAACTGRRGRRWRRASCSSSRSSSRRARPPTRTSCISTDRRRSTCSRSGTASRATRSRASGRSGCSSISASSPRRTRSLGPGVTWRPSGRRWSPRC